MRIGYGFDVHRLVEDRELWIGGVKIEHDKGLLGHSDADVAIHALCDALLGAAALRDIGYHFPDSNPQYKGIDSRKLLREVMRLLDENGYTLGNCDITICAEQPKMNPHILAMQQQLAECMQCDPAQISIKATTTERLGYTGRGEGIAAHAVALIIHK
jgi:2-C-methyl-D-erythritol 2,4-cyclodiphosphate synthase